MKTAHWLVVAAIAGGTAYTVKGCLNRPAPDQKLAGHIEDLCDIARDGAATPVAGVRKLGRYLASHGGDMAKDLVDTVALIERVPDDEAHDERARLARGRLEAAGCRADWERFNRAIDGDPDAIALIETTAIRLDRTIKILIGDGVTWRDLPSRLQQLLR